MSNSYLRPQLLAIRYDSGAPAIVWKSEKSVSNQPSPILVGEEIYYISDSGGIVSCPDALSGDLNWKERLGGNYPAVPLHAAGKIYFSSREGVTTVIEAGKSFKLVSKNSLDGSIMASIAVEGGVLFLRTDQAIYRIE